MPPIITYLILFALAAPGPTLSTASKPHVISFRSPDLYPEGLAYDPDAEHFVVGAIRHRTILAVSDAGVVETLIHDTSLPDNASFLGLAVDRKRRRLLAAVHSAPPLPPFSALAAYDLVSRRQIFLAELPGDSTDRAIANAVAVDFAGSAYVTNSAGNFIWKVNEAGEASIWSTSPLFSRFPIHQNASYSFCGLNGIAYVSKGYFLVAQTNTGKLFKVDHELGTAREVLLNKDLGGADGVALRKDGSVVVVSAKKMWFLKSDDSWGQGVVYDETDLEEERFATSVVVGREGRAYVIYGRAMEGILGNSGRERFEIEEVRSGKESEDENVWVYVLVGLGLAYFMIWRFQMRQLVRNMNKKTN